MHNNDKIAYIDDNKLNESNSSINKNDLENFVATNIETKEKQEIDDEISSEQKKDSKGTKEKNNNIQEKNNVVVKTNTDSIQNNKETNENKNIQKENSKETNDKVTEKDINNKNDTIQNEESKETDTKEEQKNENIEEKVSELAGKHYQEYNKTKTQHVVDYLNNKIKQLDGYETWGGKAIVVTSKPTNSWFSYSYDEKLDGLATIGCIIKVYIEDEYVYDNRGNPYLYDTKAYIYTE